MTIDEQLLVLQWTQLKHDESYHKDIVILPPAQRIRHMALHYAKYTAYLLEAIETGNNHRLENTLTDSFIIALAIANILNQNLGHELGAQAKDIVSLNALGSQLAGGLQRDDADPLWLVRAFARYNGRLAKACEAWDHLESVPFRDTMKAANLALFQVVLVEASARGLNLTELYKKRIGEVEDRSIFNQQYREGAGGEG